MVSKRRNDELEEKIHRVTAQIQTLEQLVTNFTISSSTTTPRLVQLHEFVQERKKALHDMVISLIYSSNYKQQYIQEELQSAMTAKFKKEHGPFVKVLDKALQSFRVQRQAYYSGTFVGNHCHTSLKVGFST